jgi:hypothetical protein
MHLFPGLPQTYRIRVCNWTRFPKWFIYEVWKTLDGKKIHLSSNCDANWKCQNTYMNKFIKYPQLVLTHHLIFNFLAWKIKQILINTKKHLSPFFTGINPQESMISISRKAFYYFRFWSVLFHIMNALLSAFLRKK